MRLLGLLQKVKKKKKREKKYMTGEKIKINKRERDDPSKEKQNGYYIFARHDILSPLLLIIYGPQSQLLAGSSSNCVLGKKVKCNRIQLSLGLQWYVS